MTSLRARTHENVVVARGRFDVRCLFGLHKPARAVATAITIELFLLAAGMDHGPAVDSLIERTYGLAHQGLRSQGSLGHEVQPPARVKPLLGIEKELA